MGQFMAYCRTLMRDCKLLKRASSKSFSSNNPMNMSNSSDKKREKERKKLKLKIKVKSAFKISHRYVKIPFIYYLFTVD